MTGGRPVVGLPGFLAYVVFAAEAVGGILLIANVATGWVSLALVPVLAGALWVHSGNGWVFSNANGGWEYPLFLIVVAVVVALQAFATRTAATRIMRTKFHLRNDSPDRVAEHITSFSLAGIQAVARRSG